MRAGAVRACTHGNRRTSSRGLPCRLLLKDHLMACWSPLQALVLEAEEKLEAQSGGGDRQALAAAATTFYEVTIASIDQPKLLSRLSESLVRRSGAVSKHLVAGAGACLCWRRCQPTCRGHVPAGTWCSCSRPYGSVAGAAVWCGQLCGSRQQTEANSAAYPTLHECTRALLSHRCCRATWASIFAKRTPSTPKTASAWTCLWSTAGRAAAQVCVLHHPAQLAS